MGLNPVGVTQSGIGQQKPVPDFFYLCDEPRAGLWHRVDDIG